jgi:hypothetical protein
MGRQRALVGALFIAAVCGLARADEVGLTVLQERWVWIGAALPPGEEGFRAACDVWDSNVETFRGVYRERGQDPFFIYALADEVTARQAFEQARRCPKFAEATLDATGLQVDLRRGEEQLARIVVRAPATAEAERQVDVTVVGRDYRTPTEDVLVEVVDADAMTSDGPGRRSFILRAEGGQELRHATLRLTLSGQTVEVVTELP